MKLTDKGFQNCGKTRFFQNIMLILGNFFEPQKTQFSLTAQGIATFNVENTVLLTPPHEFIMLTGNRNCLI